MARTAFGIAFYPRDNAPKITKIYYKGYRELVVKRIVGNKPDVWHIDCRHMADTLNYESEEIQLSKGDNFSSISVRLYGTVDDALPTSFWETSSSGLIGNVIYSDDRVTFPRYVYVDSGETGTEETDTYRPEWSKFHDRDVISEAWRKRIGYVAHRFALGFNHSWSFLNWHEGGEDPFVDHDPKTATASQKEAVARHINTANACRLLIGRVWCVVDHHANSKAPQNVREILDIDALVTKLEVQFPTPYAVQEFHNRHKIESWKVLANSDDKSMRRIYWWTKDYKRGAMLYDINRSNTRTVTSRSDKDELVVGQRLNTKKARAEYLEILACYRKAFAYPHPDAHQFVSRESF